MILGISIPHQGAVVAFEGPQWSLLQSKLGQPVRLAPAPGPAAPYFEGSRIYRATCPE